MTTLRTPIVVYSVDIMKGKIIMENIPMLSVDLIVKLNESYPERCPDVEQSDREIWMYAGARELVRNLKIKLEAQQEDELTY